MMENIYTTDLTSLTSSGKVIIEFYGNGCLNCQMMSPILDNLEHVLYDVQFYRINADDYPNLIHAYHITSLPSLLIFRDGQLLSTIVGVKPVMTLQMQIEDILNYA